MDFKVRLQIGRRIVANLRYADDTLLDTSEAEVPQNYIGAGGSPRLSQP